MPARQRPSVVLTDISFAWPDGSPLLTRATAAFGQGRTGLIGANGSGKSTVLRLIAGELTPDHGSIRATGDIGYLSQDLVLRADDTVGDLLGVRAVVEAIRAAEDGDASPRQFDIIGEDWDIEARADAVLGRMGLVDTGFDRPVSTLSGGEAVLIALAGLDLARTPIVLLDEPTNNLDRRSVEELVDALNVYRGAMIVVSHDDRFLRRVGIGTWLALDDEGLTIADPPGVAETGERERDAE